MSICPKCNAQLADGSKFCRYCGAKLDEPAASAAPSPSQPTQSNAGGKSSRYLKYANYLNDNALFNVAYAKENGVVRSDYPDEAEEIYEYLALKDHTESMYRYAMLQMKKQPPNTELASKWLRLAESKGHAASANYLRTMTIPKPTSQPAPTAPTSAPAPAGSVLSGEEIYNRMEYAAVEILAIASENDIGRASGFVVSDHGFVVTNAHAVLDRNKELCKVLKVKIHDQILSAFPVAFGSPADGSHDLLDIALLYVPELEIKAISVFGESSKCRNGQKVYLIGNSLGSGICITSGIISDATRKMPGLSYPYIMTDAAANPGNSGGPLLNERGEVIGVLVAGIDSAEGMNFAIPIDVVKEFFKFLATETNLDAAALGHLAAPSNTPVNMSTFSDNLFKGLHLVLDVIAFLLTIFG